MPDTLYETDPFAWYLREAALLQRLAESEAGVRSGIDWVHVIDEVGFTGRIELRQVSVGLHLALSELMQAGLQGDLRERAFCFKQAESGLRTAARHYRPSMLEHLTMEVIWRDAIEDARFKLRSNEAALSLPESCPFTLDELLSGRLDLQVAAKQLRG